MKVDFYLGSCSGMNPFVMNSGCGQKLPTKLIPDVYVIMVGQLSDQLSGQMVNRGTLHTCYTLPDVY